MRDVLPHHVSVIRQQDARPPTGESAAPRPLPTAGRRQRVHQPRQHRCAFRAAERDRGDGAGRRDGAVALERSSGRFGRRRSPTAAARSSGRARGRGACVGGGCILRRPNQIPTVAPSMPMTNWPSAQSTPAALTSKAAPSDQVAARRSVRSTAPAGPPRGAPRSRLNTGQAVRRRHAAVAVERALHLVLRPQPEGQREDRTEQQQQRRGHRDGE